MIDEKDKIVENFKKIPFKLADFTTKDNILENSWECVDEYIREFLMKLNKNPHIQTHFSCEGHKKDDNAYFSITVDSIGWYSIWLECLPKLLSIKKESELGDCYIPILITVDNMISIHCQLKDGQIHTWEELKEWFWKNIFEIFLNAFKS